MIKHHLHDILLKSPNYPNFTVGYIPICIQFKEPLDNHCSTDREKVLRWELPCQGLEPNGTKASTLAVQVTWITWHWLQRSLRALGFSLILVWYSPMSNVASWKILELVAGKIMELNCGLPVRFPFKMPFGWHESHGWSQMSRSHGHKVGVETIFQRHPYDPYGP